MNSYVEQYRPTVLAHPVPRLAKQGAISHLNYTKMIQGSSELDTSVPSHIYPALSRNNLSNIV